MTKKQTAIDKTLVLLNTFKEPPHQYTARELSEKLGFNKATVHRILNTLVDHNFVNKREGGHYHVGYGTYLVGMQYPKMQDVYAEIRNVVNSLAAKTKLQVGYSILRDNKVISVYESASFNQQIAYMPGEMYPVNGGVYGKVLMANTYTLKVLKNLVHEIDLDSAYPGSITDPKLFYKALETTKLKGYALSDGEHIEGEIGIGAPVYKRDGTFHGSIALSGIKSEALLARKKDLIQEVLESATAIGQLLL